MTQEEYEILKDFTELRKLADSLEYSLLLIKEHASSIPKFYIGIRKNEDTSEVKPRTFSKIYHAKLFLSGVQSTIT